MMKRIAKLSALIFCLVAPGLSCTYRLSLNGASIPANMKTVRVDFFENNAALVVNNLSTQFTEALKDRIRNTTRLAIVTGDADGEFSGSITDYNIAPVSISASSSNVAPIAGASRLTITVSVKYVNNVDKKLNFEQSFSQYQNFSGDINAQEQTLIAAINKQLTEDIFNQAFASWN